MDYFRAKDKNDAVRKSEADGKVADSLDVRVALIERMKSGELTLEQVQAMLKKIKANAKRDGKTTRAKVWRSS